MKSILIAILLFVGLTIAYFFGIVKIREIVENRKAIFWSVILKVYMVLIGTGIVLLGKYICFHLLR